MPSVLVQRQRAARARARAAQIRTRASPRAAGAPFHEVASIPTLTPLDAWSGWDGQGWGPAGSLWVTSGARQGNRDLHSRVWRLDTPDGQWVDDGVPSGAEVLNKIRSGSLRGSNLDHLVAFFETPRSGQPFLVARRANTSWEFLDVPATSTSYDDPVGGRGLAFQREGPSGGRVCSGASYQWRDDRPGHLFEQRDDGSWSHVRDLRPSLLWELEFDAQGRLWEFWNDFGLSSAISRVYVNGFEKGVPPGGDISCANWFPASGHMYTIGALSSGGTGAPQEAPRNEINRSANGDSWERVHTFSQAQQGDHVLWVPRGGNGEMWATAHDPFQVAYSLNGFSWTVEPTIPAVVTGRDTNHMTAIAYWKGAVWVMTRAHGENRTRVFTDYVANGNGGEPEPEPTPEPPPPSTGIVFPSLAVPPRPPELPTVPVAATQPTTKAADVFPKGDQPPMQKWVEGADRFVAETSLRYDAILTKWIDEFIRVIKDAWARLSIQINVIVGRIATLETRVSDTYTWGSGSITKDKLIALPLRVVRDETFLEMTIAAETASTSGDVQIDLVRNDATLISGTLSSGSTFVVKVAEDKPALAVNDKLAVITRNAGTGVKGVVCQARCR